MVWVFLATLEAPLVENSPVATSMGWPGKRGMAVAQVGAPSPDLSLPQTRSPQPVCWAQHGVAQLLTTHLDLPWRLSHGLTAWTAGTALCIPVLGVVHAGAQRTWMLLKLPRKHLTKCGPQAAGALPPPRPALAPGGVQARVTCFCSRPDSPGAWGSWALWPGPQWTHQDLPGTFLEEWVLFTVKLAWASGSLFARVLPKPPPEALGPSLKDALWP